MRQYDPEKQRAVLYARCSTEEESQRDALQKQVQEGRDCIGHKGWVLADVYVEAVSGTVAGRRTEYQRLLRDMKYDKYDIIVIKCLDRLMRETKEWFYFCDKLNQEGKRLYLYLDGRFFEPEEDHANLLSGIEAIMAEQYSRNLSRKINNAHRNRQISGEAVVLTSRTYGYRKENKQVLIDREQAEAVKKMFCYCREGLGGRMISQMLEQQGYRNLNGNPIGEATIRRIIRNPLYKGTAVMNKAHYDFNKKCLIRNEPENWIYHEGAVPAIVDAGLWDEANRAMDQRLGKTGQSKVQLERISKTHSPLSGKLICGLCKRPYYRCRGRCGETGKRQTEWKCSKYLSRGRKGPNGCDNVHVGEEALINILWEAGKKLPGGSRQLKDTVIERTLCVLKEILGVEQMGKNKRMLEQEIETLMQKREQLLDLLLRGVVDEDIYVERNRILKESMGRKREELKTLKETDYEKIQEEKRLEVIRQRLKQDIAETAIVYGIVDKMEQIEVYPDHIAVWFCQNHAGEKGDLENIEIPCTLLSSRKLLREKENKEIIRMMKNNPRITAREIAVAMNKNFSLVRRRIERLREENKIHYIGRGGHGYWEAGENHH